jgi:hypothetical protein
MDIKDIMEKEVVIKSILGNYGDVARVKSR